MYQGLIQGVDGVASYPQWHFTWSSASCSTSGQHNIYSFIANFQSCPRPLATACMVCILSVHSSLCKLGQQSVSTRFIFHMVVLMILERHYLKPKQAHLFLDQWLYILCYCRYNFILTGRWTIGLMCCQCLLQWWFCHQLLPSCSVISHLCKLPEYFSPTCVCCW